jgi:hypothetical protein
MTPVLALAGVNSLPEHAPVRVKYADYYSSAHATVSEDPELAELVPAVYNITRLRSS